MEQVFHAPQVAAGLLSDAMWAPSELKSVLALNGLGWEINLNPAVTAS